ncbi:MAG: nucleotide sugar dehydrogenase [Lentisphaeraceae bacterium]|nr:nucleotide sugar dehydrogenase [Lentisphaeraceae bacterium]
MISKNILCIGAGYVGGPTMATIAANCPNYIINVVDLNQSRIDAWNSGDLPVFEPGLGELIEKQRGKNLFFSTDVIEGIKQADVIFVCVNTPTKTFGLGAGKAADLQFCEKTARQISEYAQKDLIVVEKSTVPVRTSKIISEILESGDSKHSFEVISNPEFLAEGTAIADLQNPDRVLIGGRPTPEGEAAVAAISEIYENWISKGRIITTDSWSSELSKLAANAFLAQRVSSINSISAICEETGADVSKISEAIGADSRIGAKFLKSGPGFGGSCFQKDILNLVYLCETLGLSEVAQYWQSVIDINEYQKKRIVKNVISSMFNSVAGKKIAVLGFAFKADTGDTRESPAIQIVNSLVEERAEVAIYDPQAIPQAREDLKGLTNIIYCDGVSKATVDAHAVIVVTDWQEFRGLDFKKIFQSMVRPAHIFDTRGCLNAKELYELGFNVHTIGQKPKIHKR